MSVTTGWATMGYTTMRDSTSVGKEPIGTSVGSAGLSNCDNPPMSRQEKDF